MKFVIGDIHGEISKLKNLVNLILNEDKNPELIFVGDYLDKGEDSYQTLLYLSELKSRLPCQFLLGNHEYYWSNFFNQPDEMSEHLTKYGGATTMADFGQKTLADTAKKIQNEFSELFQSLKLYWENDQFIVTHSGLNEIAFTQNASDFKPSDLLFNRYQFISGAKQYHNKKIIFGHTGFYNVFYDQNKIGVDTSACYLKDQPLSAFCLEKEFILQSNGKKMALQNLPTNMCPNIPRVKPYRFCKVPKR